MIAQIAPIRAGGAKTVRRSQANPVECHIASLVRITANHVAARISVTTRASVAFLDAVFNSNLESFIASGNTKKEVASPNGSATKIGAMKYRPRPAGLSIGGDIAIVSINRPIAQPISERAEVRIQRILESWISLRCSGERSFRCKISFQVQGKAG